VKDDIERIVRARLVPELSRCVNSLKVCSLRQLVWDELVASFQETGYTPVRLGHFSSSKPILSFHRTIFARGLTTSSSALVSRRRSRTSLSLTSRLLARSLPCALVATGFVASGLIARRTTHGARSCVICASCATHGRAFSLSSSCIAWSSSTRTNLTGLSDYLILVNFLFRNKCIGQFNLCQGCLIV
jgi:hypothetical protein